MFGFFWRGKNKAAGAGSQEAPETRIPHDPSLLDDLQTEHQQLLRLFAQLTDTYEARNYAQIPAMLDQFGSLLRGHLLKENVKLYIYLQQALAEDPENASLMREFRSEMNGISKTITSFLTLYGNTGWSEQRKQSFGAELAAIGDVLRQRIETEEGVLYPLYLPPEAYH